MPARTPSMRHWRAVSLSPDMPMRLPGVEQPGPELPGLSEVALQARPELPDLAGGEESEHVVWFRLSHELSGEIGPNLRVRILETLSKLFEGHLGVPEEVGLALRVDETFR